MVDEEKKVFVVLLFGIAQTFKESLSEHAIEIYWQTLKRYSLVEIREAITNHCSNINAGRFFPKPADIIAAIIGDTRAQAQQAWSKVIKAVQSVGPYSCVAFDDPIIHVVIDDMGGWVKLCRIKVDQEIFIAKDFQERYQHCVVNRPIHYPQYLPGIFSNQHEVMLIGDETKAKQVMTSNNSPPPSIQCLKNHVLKE